MCIAVTQPPGVLTVLFLINRVTTLQTIHW